MTPGDQIYVDGKAFVVRSVYPNGSYTVHAKGIRMMKLWKTNDVWRYGKTGRVVKVEV